MDRRKLIEEIQVIYLNKLIQVKVLQVKNMTLNLGGAGSHNKSQPKTAQTCYTTASPMSYQPTKIASAQLKKNIENIADVHGKIQELNQAAKLVFERFCGMTSILQEFMKVVNELEDGPKKKLMKIVEKIKNEQKDTVFRQKLQYISKCANSELSKVIESSIAKGECKNPKRIRGYQSKVKAKLCQLIKKKYGSVNHFLELFPDAFIPTMELGSYLRELGLNRNQALMVLKIMDPQNSGTITHQYFKTLIQHIAQKQIQQYYKNVQQLVAVWKTKDLNLMTVFEMADSRHFDVVTPHELQKAFAKVLSDQPQSKIKKWVQIINENKDNKVTRQEYVDMVRGFYLMNEFDQFPEQYIKKYPELNTNGYEAHKRHVIAVKELNAVLKQKGMKKKQVFHYIDFNKSGDVDKREIIEGLKSLGVGVGLIGRFLCVLTQKQTELIDVQEWVRILSLDSQKPKKPKNKVKDLEDTKSTVKFEVAQKEKRVEKKKKSKRNSLFIQTIKTPSKGKRSNSRKSQRSHQSSSKRKQQKYNSNTLCIEAKATEKSKLKKSSNKKKGYLYINQVLEKNYGKKDDPPQVESATQIMYDEKDKKGQKKAGFQLIQKAIRDDAPKNTIMVNQKEKKQVVKTDQVKPKVNDFDFKKLIKQNCSQEEPKKPIIQKDKYDDLNLIEKVMKKTDQKPTEQPQKKAFDKNQCNILQNLLKNEDKMDKIEDKFILQTLFKQTQKKRGENIKQFNILQHIGLFCEQKQKGYKMIDYISDGTNQLQKKRQALVQKAKKLKQSKKLYEDPQFPPNTQSIIGKTQPTKVQDHEKLQWKHYKKINPKFQLFGKEVTPSDIEQGGLGDCYLLSSFSGLAQYRNMVQRLFQYADLEIGYFLIWLCVDGVWGLVQIDGYLPCRVDSGQIAFGSSNNDKLWVSLLEKAYAKSYGSYSNIVGGVQSQAIKDLTGCPGVYRAQKQISWKELLQANERQYIMNAGTKKSQGTTIDGHEQDVDQVNGIVFQHSYSILDCRQINNEKIIQLRNPWGNTEWKGDQWADSASKWTDEMKKKLGHNSNENDGTFWMKFESFLKFFNAYTINYLRPQHIYRQKCLKSITEAVVKIPIKQFTQGYLIISHEDHRHKQLPRHIPYDASNFSKCFIYNKKQAKVVKSYPAERVVNSRETFKQFTNADKYSNDCYVMMILQFAEKKNISVGFYADKMVNMEIQGNSQQYEEKLAQFAENQEGNQKNQSNSYVSWTGIFNQNSYQCFKNKKSTKLTIEVEIQGQNVESSKTKLEIEPGAVKTVKVKKVNVKEGCNFGYSVSQMVRKS